MPNPWTGKGNPYTRQEVRDRLQNALDRGEPIIAAGAGTGISAKFIEKGGADLLIVYNSGRFRMSGHGSTCGLMAYGDANAVAGYKLSTEQLLDAAFYELGYSPIKSNQQRCSICSVSVCEGYAAIMVAR